VLASDRRSDISLSNFVPLYYDHSTKYNVKRTWSITTVIADLTLTCEQLLKSYRWPDTIIILKLYCIKYLCKIKQLLLKLSLSNCCMEFKLLSFYNASLHRFFLYCSWMAAGLRSKYLLKPMMYLAFPLFFSHNEYILRTTFCHLK